MPLRPGYVYLQDQKSSPVYVGCIITLSMATLAVIIYLLVHYVARGISNFSKDKTPLYRRRLGTNDE